jgi:hypothetical protein
MKINKDRFITVMKIVNGKPQADSVKLFYQSNLLLLRESTNKFKYSICLNKGCNPVLMSLNNRKMGIVICEQLNKITSTQASLTYFRKYLIWYLMRYRPYFYFYTAGAYYE